MKAKRNNYVEGSSSKLIFYSYKKEKQYNVLAIHFSFVYNRKLSVKTTNSSSYQYECLLL